MAKDKSSTILQYQADNFDEIQKLHKKFSAMCNKKDVRLALCALTTTASHLIAQCCFDHTIDRVIDELVENIRIMTAAIKFQESLEIRLKQAKENIIEKRKKLDKDKAKTKTKAKAKSNTSTKRKKEPIKKV
jgi:hypothetical protein